MHACMHVCGNKGHKGHAPCALALRPPPQKAKSTWASPPSRRKTRPHLLSLLLFKWQPILSLVLPPHVVKLSQVALASSLPKLKSLDPYMAAFSTLKANNEITHLFIQTLIG